ncbi:hypothetical protein os1_27260 [Comamonadaceae bacterium OS-1]|nr:hypothetical protein os1_27260 [Comamonadaceae bacterium OS-1]
MATAIPTTTSNANQNTVLAEPRSEPLGAMEFLERTRGIGIHWWSIISSVLEAHQHHDHIYPNSIEPLPQWAVDRLNDHGQHESSETEFTEQVKLLAEALRLSAGDGSNYRYQVWTTRGARLAIKHMSWEEAVAVADRLKGRFPDAFVARVHVKDTFRTSSDPVLLDTLIGRIEHTATSFHRGHEDQFSVQDETGRQVTVAASILQAHAVYQRLEEAGKASVDHSMQRTKMRAISTQRDAVDAVTA